MLGILKDKLRSNIPAMSDAFRSRIEEAIASEMKCTNSKCLRKEVCRLEDAFEYRTQEILDQIVMSGKISLMPALLRIFTRVNLLAFP